MDFDFDLEDLGDLDNLDCDWDNLVVSEHGVPEQSPQEKQQQHQNQLQQQQQQEEQRQLLEQQQQQQLQQLQQQLQQQQEQQQQQQQQLLNNQNQSGSTNGLYQSNENGHYQNGINNHPQDQDSHITPGNVQQSLSPVDPNAPTPGTSNNATTNEAFQIRYDRERDGRCADCGAQTHEVQFDPSGSGRSIKNPLSVPGEVHRGRCLFCHPLPSARSSRKRTSDPPSQAQQQQQFQRSSSQHTQQGIQGYGEGNQLDQHLNNNASPSPAYPNRSSSASVCTASSQQSSQSIYSQQSAPTWGGGQNQQQQLQQNPNNNGYGAELAENYQQQQMLLQMQQQMQQQQQYPDDGSVYSHASHKSHQSHHSIYSQASNQSQASYQSYNQQIASPQINPTNIDTQFHRSGSATSSVSPNTALNDFTSSSAAADVIYRQMTEDSLDIEKCIQAMRRFPSHSHIQERGCAMLWAQSNNAEVCIALSNMGGVTVIMDAMRNYPVMPNLQRAGCEALRNMCVHVINRQLLLQGGGVALMAEMMRRHVDNPEIQRSGCTALASVAEGGMECKIAVAECGGILAVMKAVEIHPENDIVLRAAYQALRMLGYNPGANNGGM